MSTVEAPIPPTSENEPSPLNAVLMENIRLFSRYGPTIRSLFFTILMSAFIPGVLAFVAWQMFPAYDISTLQGCVCRGLMYIVFPFWGALILHRSLKQGGFAEGSLGWSPAVCHALGKTVNMVVWVYLPLRFLYYCLESFQNGAYFDSLGRIFFSLAMMSLAFGLWSTWRHLRRFCETQQASSIISHRHKCAMLAIVMITPVALVVMAMAGYYFTAVQLSVRLVTTILVAIAIALVAALTSRLLLIIQFRIKLRQLERNADGSIQEDESIDIAAISDQVNRLLRVTAIVGTLIVAWQIWSNVIPSIALLDVALWENKAEFAKTGIISQITVKHLLVSCAMLVITWVLSRNLPGLLEITLLDRLPLDKGGRYAISFVCRYIVGIIGMLMAFQMIGFSWSSLQWLAAGLTVGLGFGLQEIFANLVSGIIILIERPVRVGDIVTVNGVTGTVTQMQLRATTIKDLDHRELIVPNKKFITEDVMNWTLSDQRSRLVFNVGIAYGSDTRLAQETLLQVARRNPNVMLDPAPEVVFKKFGDSTLDFQLRVVIPTREKFAQVEHQLNMAIDQAFRDKKIEIAFPQRDITIKNIQQAWPSGPHDGSREKSSQTSIHGAHLGPADAHGPVPSPSPGFVMGQGRDDRQADDKAA